MEGVPQPPPLQPSPLLLQQSTVGRAQTTMMTMNLADVGRLYDKTNYARWLHNVQNEKNFLSDARLKSAKKRVLNELTNDERGASKSARKYCEERIAETARLVNQMKRKVQQLDGSTIIAADEGTTAAAAAAVKALPMDQWKERIKARCNQSGSYFIYKKDPPNFLPVRQSPNPQMEKRRSKSQIKLPNLPTSPLKIKRMSTDDNDVTSLERSPKQSQSERKRASEDERLLNRSIEARLGMTERSMRRENRQAEKRTTAESHSLSIFPTSLTENGSALLPIINDDDDLQVTVLSKTEIEQRNKGSECVKTEGDVTSERKAHSMMNLRNSSLKVRSGQRQIMLSGDSEEHHRIDDQSRIERSVSEIRKELLAGSEKSGRDQARMSRQLVELGQQQIESIERVRETMQVSSPEKRKTERRLASLLSKQQMIASSAAVIELCAAANTSLRANSRLLQRLSSERSHDLKHIALYHRVAQTNEFPSEQQSRVIVQMVQNQEMKDKLHANRLAQKFKQQQFEEPETFSIHADNIKRLQKTLVKTRRDKKINSFGS